MNHHLDRLVDGTATITSIKDGPGAHTLTMERMALYAAAARRVGDERTAAYWTEAVEVASLRAQINEWDVLKGSPEHG